MRIFFFFLLIISLCSCTDTTPEFTQVQIEEVFTDSLNTIRDIYAKDADNIWFSAGNGRVGVLQAGIPKLASVRYNETTLKFKSLSVQDEVAYFLHPTHPALVYKLDYDNEEAKSIESVYVDEDASVFFNMLAFWDAEKGILVGEREGSECLEIILTMDGGNTWKKVDCSDLPSLVEGEVLFASSNSNVSVAGSNIWIATGGKKARVFHSPDYGKTWEVYNTPFIQGNGGMGIFSIDFLDEKHGVAIGGKWSDKKFNAGNKAYTKDGGKTWKLFANDAYPALQKQVSFVPNSSKTSIVAVGDDGISYTSDAKEWIKLSDKRLEHIYFVSKTVAYASENGTLYRLTFQ